MINIDKDGSISQLLQPESSTDVFPELALSLYVFTDALYKKLKKAQVRDVFFLSREGQPLMRLFQAYQSCLNLAETDMICCHYLEVSRRSTFLPSLDALDTECFEMLFRQYRSISIQEFLSSLGLESLLASLALDLNITEQAFKERVQDLPTHPLYQQLIKNIYFKQCYESERVARRHAFVQYLKGLVGGILPDVLHIVDVGWKGTIQDNLFRLLCQKPSATIKAIEGYYIGLVGLGAASHFNKKNGILFSLVNPISYGSKVFNENKSLFEVVLAANHGSTSHYIIDELNVATPVRSHFDEVEMVERFVLPLQKQILKRFFLLHHMMVSSQKDFLAITAFHHARMVFAPSKAEMEWFSMIFHVENFGVFENSYFNLDGQEKRFWRRAIFTLKLATRPRRVNLGFWPWLTIYYRAGGAVARLYRYFRSKGL